MRHKGRITGWKDAQGFGFITPSRGGEKIFLHISAFSKRGRRPVDNDLVTYELTFDRKKRARAGNVRFSREAAAASRRESGDSITLLLAGLFLVFGAGTVLMGGLPAIASGVYLIASIVAFLAYFLDKSAARKGRWRTSELTLHLISLAGGWPGALLAQRVLRHKSSKPEFQRVYWATVVLNCAALLWLLTSDAAMLLKWAR